MADEGDDVSREAALAGRVRAVLRDVEGIAEVRMFGGIGFMLSGNLLAAVSRRGLLLRVGREANAAMSAHPGVRPMEMRGRPLDDYVQVDPPVAAEGDAAAWLGPALAFVRALPAKPPKPQKAPRRG